MSSDYSSQKRNIDSVSSNFSGFVHMTGREVDGVEVTGTSAGDSNQTLKGREYIGALQREAQTEVRAAPSAASCSTSARRFERSPDRRWTRKKEEAADCCLGD